jgi:hypothetical protein
LGVNPRPVGRADRVAQTLGKAAVSGIMTTLLFILQIAGGLLAAGAAIASLFKSKGFEEIEIPSPIIGAPSRIERHFSRAAKIGAILVIAGFLVSLIAGIITPLLNSRRNLQNQQIISAQLQKAEQSLHYLQRLATRFDKVSFSVKYEPAPPNVYFALLCEYADRLVPKVSVPIKPPVPTGQPRTNFSGNLVGYIHGKRFSQSSDRRELQFDLPSADILLTQLSTNSVNPRHLAQVVNFLCSPMFSIVIYTPHNRERVILTYF